MLTSKEYEAIYFKTKGKICKLTNYRNSVTKSRESGIAQFRIMTGLDCLTEHLTTMEIMQDAVVHYTEIELKL